MLSQYKWKIIGAFIAWFVGVIVGIIAIVSYLYDKPDIRVEITASPPIFRFASTDPWTQDGLKVILGDLADITMARVSIGYLKSNGLISDKAISDLNDRDNRLKAKLSQMLTRIPLQVTVSNNGPRDTTIVSGRLSVRGDSNQNLLTFDMGKIRKFIGSGNVVDLKDIHMDFNSRRPVPMVLLKKMIIDGVSEKLMTCGLLPEESKMSLNQLLPKYFQVHKDSEWKNIPLTIEIQLTDQYGSVSSNSTVILDKMNTQSIEEPN